MSVAMVKLNIFK